MVVKERDSYDDFLSSIHPVILGLTSCHVDLDRQRRWRMKSGDPDRRTLGADYRVDAIKDDHFDISADFTVSIQAIGADGMPEEKSYLSVQCVFYGHFHGRGKVKEEDVRRFADHEARLVFVPYLRQFVTDMTARMSIPPLMIPLAIGTRIAGEDRPALPSKRPARPRAKTVKRQP